MTKSIDLQPAAGFELRREARLAASDVRMAWYEHPASGARHLHLGSDDRENAFMVAFRTPPANSTGIAHILEHTALCGSRRYPVRDPFFMMLRRSLNTFMNAFTGSDWTAYPFSTCNRRDFQNLLQVYLDATFFPLLDEMDFEQEGWRLEVSDDDLIYSGVVYNEMKGAMSAPGDQLYHQICRRLYPDSHYRHNSGGDPAHIVDLRHADLVEFHRAHYRPDNATFMSYGDIPPAEHQEQFQALALNKFNGSPKPAELPPMQKPLPTPARFRENYTRPETEKGDGVYLIFGWLLGDRADTLATAEAQLMSAALLDHGASPLRHFLETTELGEAPAPLCGLMDDHRQIFFSAGVQGSRAADADAFEEQLLKTLRAVADEGLPEGQLEAVLHQFELRATEIDSNQGLHLMMACLPATLYNGDPMATLDAPALLRELRRRAKRPDFIPELLRRHLLDNPHRVLLVSEPDAELAQRLERDERRKLRDIKQGFNAERLAEVRRRCEAIAARQRRRDDPGVLPRLELADVPERISTPKPKRRCEAPPIQGYSCATRGMSYQQLLFEMPALSERQLELYPLYARLLTEVGVGADDYLRVQARAAGLAGALSAGAATRTQVDDASRCQGALHIRASALHRNHAAVSALLRETMDGARFDEVARIRELIASACARHRERLTGVGHELAIGAAIAALSPAAAFAENSGGLSGMSRLAELNQKVQNDDDAAERLCDELAELHKLTRAMPMQALCVAKPRQLNEAMRAVAADWSDHKPSGARAMRFEATPEARPRIWRCNSQINFCARAWPALPLTHPDSPKLAVLAAFLTHGCLHRMIRESGGAYGGGLRHLPATALCFFSYRDPRLGDTFADFDAAPRWLLESEHEPRMLEEAILSVIGGLDRPQAPAAEAAADFHDRLRGWTPRRARGWRRRVLGTTLDDLRRLARRHLAPTKRDERSIAAAIVPADADIEALDFAADAEVRRF